MTDTRLFRMTRQGRAWNGMPTTPHVEYGNKRIAAAKCGAGGVSFKYGPVVKVEATNAESTSGWADVTSEFIKEDE